MTTSKTSVGPANSSLPPSALVLYDLCCGNTYEVCRNMSGKYKWFQILCMYVQTKILLQKGFQTYCTDVDT